jgi:hypothetical protein
MSPSLRVAAFGGLLLVAACSASNNTSAVVQEAPRTSAKAAPTSVEVPDEIPNQRFDACTETQECVLLPGVCADPQGVNRTQTEAFKAQVAAQAPLVDCVTPPRNPPRYLAQCVQDRCVAVPRP